MVIYLTYDTFVDLIHVDCFRCGVPGVMDGDEPRSFVTLYELEGLVYRDAWLHVITNILSIGMKVNSTVRLKCSTPPELTKNMNSMSNCTCSWMGCTCPAFCQP